MTEDQLKAEASEDKSRSDLNLKKKSSLLSRSHSCRKADSGSRWDFYFQFLFVCLLFIFRKKLSSQDGSAEDVVAPGDEDELLDVVDDHLQNVNISMKCQKGFSTRPIPSI